MKGEVTEMEKDVYEQNGAKSNLQLLVSRKTKNKQNPRKKIFRYYKFYALCTSSKGLI